MRLYWTQDESLEIRGEVCWTRFLLGIAFLDVDHPGAITRLSVVHLGPFALVVALREVR